ncbi:MAG: hypothetical protein J7L15_08985 [Clostridiales bacterium]|nr:hypothetical protein [Clostridiales bacterium]
MSQIFKKGGRYGLHSGASKWKHIEITGDIKGRSLVTMGCGLVVASSSFPWDTTANAEQAAALCKVSDGGVFLNLSGSGAGAGYTANYQLFPDTEVVNDAVYFGYASKFGAMYIDMSATVGVYNDDALTWEYRNSSGTWTAFTPYDETDTTAQNGKRSFQGDGYIILNVGEDWTAGLVDSQNAFWIRARVSAAEITTIPLTNDKEHLVTTLSKNGTVMSQYGVISRGLFRFETVSGSTADTKVILVNMTTGQSSGEKTLTKALADNEVSDFNLRVSRGDSIAFFCTTEDGSTEFAGGTCELSIEYS